MIVEVTVRLRRAAHGALVMAAFDTVEAAAPPVASHPGIVPAGLDDGRARDSRRGTVRASRLPARCREALLCAKSMATRRG